MLYLISIQLRIQQRSLATFIAALSTREKWAVIRRRKKKEWWFREDGYFEYNVIDDNGTSTAIIFFIKSGLQNSWTIIYGCSLSWHRSLVSLDHSVELTCSVPWFKGHIERLFYAKLRVKKSLTARFASPCDTASSGSGIYRLDTEAYTNKTMIHGVYKINYNMPIMWFECWAFNLCTRRWQSYEKRPSIIYTHMKHQENEGQ